MEVDMLQSDKGHLAAAGTQPRVAANEELLVCMAQQGAETAFLELWEKCASRTARIIYSIVKNNEDVDDLLQETFIRAFTHIRTFDGRAQFSTWITRIAINTSLMVLRSRRKRSELSLDFHFQGEGHIPLDLADPAPSPEAACLRRNSIAELKGALDLLPRKLREVAVLRCSSDLPIVEIAGIVGISISATKSRLMRASTELKQTLSAERRIEAELRCDPHTLSSKGP